MSSKCQVELCSYDQVEKTRQERQPENEKQETEIPYSNNQPAESQRQEEPGAGQILSPDHDDRQEVTSEGGSEQAPREEAKTCEKRMGVSRFSVKEKRQRGGTGAHVLKRHIQKSKPKSSPIPSNLDRDEKVVKEPQGSGPFFFIGGKNGAEIVSNYCESRGWKRIYNKHREDFKLRWCETRSPAFHGNFREGEQLVFQIPNNNVLTTKIGLLNSLREYERVSSKVKHGRAHRRLKLEEFIPRTFRMDVREEREVFFALSAQQEGERKRCMWICKPSGQNQGKGIFLLKSHEDVTTFRLKLERLEDRQSNRKVFHRQAEPYVVQHYIQNPLLLEERKFDVRSYLLIACTTPYMVFFRHGYVRLTCDAYDPSSDDLSAHLTNQYMQKKHPLYISVKEDTVWSMESFNEYVNDRFRVAKGLPRDWVLGVFARRMQQIMTQCFFAVKPKLKSHLGFFDLIGCDFLIDEDFKVWLLEMNCNPALHTHCQVLKEVIPRTVVETLDLTLEIFNKCRRGQKILPLVSQRDFVLLYGVSTPGFAECRQRINKKPEDGAQCVDYLLRGTDSLSVMGCCSVTQRHTGVDEVGPDEIELLELFGDNLGVWNLGETRLQLSVRSSRDEQQLSPPPSHKPAAPPLEQEASVTLWGRSKNELHHRIYSQQPIRGWEGQPAHMYGEIIHSSLLSLYDTYTQERSERFLVLFSFHLLILSLDHSQQDFIYEGILPVSGLSFQVLSLDSDTSDSPNTFEISSPVVNSKIFICAGAAELQKWMQHIEDRRYKSTTHTTSPSYCTLSYLLPCDEHWKKEELKKYLLQAPIRYWEGSPIQHMGQPGYISIVHIINSQRQGLQERLMVLFPQDVLLLSLDSKQLNVKYEGRLARHSIRAVERSALPGRLTFELTGEMVEPLQVSCTCLEDYQNWIFQLQQPDRGSHTPVSHPPPPLKPKLQKSRKESQDLIIAADQCHINGRG